MNEPKPDSSDAREIIVPVLEEQLLVSKRVMPKSRVQVSTVTRQHEELVDELLAREHVEIERIPIGRRIDVMPGVREEDGTTIVPVVEEVVVVERQLILKEELRIRRIRETERHQERVTLRKQEATVTRLPVEEEAAASTAASDGREEIK
jgi:stress response protein YsnF